MKKRFLILLFFIPILALGQAEQRWERIKPISAQVELATPDTADWLLIEDVSDANARKKISVAALTAGLSLNFDSVSFTQQFFRSGQFVAGTGDNVVTFSSPFPDANYSVFANATSDNPRLQSLIIRNQTAAGFTIKGVIDTALVNWTAQREVEKLAALVDSLQRVVQNISGADSLGLRGDTISIYAGDSLLSSIVLPVSEGSGVSVFRYDKLLSDNETVIDIGTDVTSSTLVFVNGYAVSNFSYSGTEVTLSMSINENDYFTAASAGDTPVYYDILTTGETVVTLPYTATVNSLVFYNGVLLKPPQYSGSLNLGLNVYQNDNLIVKK